MTGGGPYPWRLTIVLIAAAVIASLVMIWGYWTGLFTLAS